MIFLFLAVLCIFFPRDTSVFIIIISTCNWIFVSLLLTLDQVFQPKLVVMWFFQSLVALKAVSSYKKNRVMKQKKKKNFEKEAWERVGLDSFLHMKLIVSTVISLPSRFDDSTDVIQNW